MTGDPPPSAAPAPASGRRLGVYYVALAAIAFAAVGSVVVAAAGRQAQPAIAGGYDLAGGAQRCLASQVDLDQSGQFVTLVTPGKGAGGKARFRDGRITGTVTCRDGTSAAVALRVRGARLVGRVGNARLAAIRRRDPPPAGTQTPRSPGGIAGEYAVSPRSACLGGSIELHGGSALRVRSGERSAGRVAYDRDSGAIRGRVGCETGRAVAVTGQAVGRRLDLTIGAERVTAQKRREFGRLLAAFFIAVAVVMLAARLVGAAAARIAQPRVMGEVAAGILLGPTLFGVVAARAQTAIFPEDVVPLIGVAANLGLIFYMFLVGLELDVSQLHGRVRQAVAISNTGVVIPMVAGLIVALPVFELLAPDTTFLPFGLFMGVAMSITAFPVLARILVERRMLKRPVGALALASAAIDDVSAWFLIALATAVAVAGSALGVVRTIVLALAFCAAMALLVRPVLARASVAYEEAGRVPAGWITAIFAGVLLSAFTTETIGIALIFGAFVMGAIMPRHAGLTEDVTHRIEDFVVLLLLPLFFAYTGLRTNVLLLDRRALVLLTLVLFLVAVTCKFGGTLLAARVVGLPWRESAVLGALMNTRGLTELIVLNLALEKGVISEALFAALVIMALATTFMTGPALRLLDPRNAFGAPVEEELEEARRRSEVDIAIPVPERAILVAPRSPAALRPLVGLGEALARSTPPRELIVADLLVPTRAGAVRGALQTENRRVAEADAETQRVRSELIERGVAARAVAFVSANAGRDLTHLARSNEVDLMLLDGRRPLLGDGVPSGDVGTVLREAPCDVAVLVAREPDEIALAGATVTVAFGGAEHDWAALELAGWLAAARGAQLRLIGAAAGAEGGARDAAGLLADASLLLQAFAGIAAEPRLAAPGRAGIIEAAAGSAMLVLGLSERWREEGLGPTRQEIVRAAEWPILFVRRGQRPGALAPRDAMTRFSWSIAGAPTVG